MAAAGCASLNRKPAADNVVAARQLSLRGMEAMQRGRWEEAESLFGRAVATCPMDERAHGRYAETLWHRGEFDEAIAHMRQSVALSGGDPEVLVQLGEMHLARGELEEAEERAAQAIWANRQLPAARALQGDILQRLGRPEDALASYYRALSYQPHYPRVELAIAEIYRGQGRPRRALGTLQALADRYPPGAAPQQVLVLEGLALKELGRHGEAAASLSAARAQGEPSVELLYQLGEAQLAAGSPTNAGLTLSAALALDPGHAASRRLQQQIDGQRQKMAALADRRTGVRNTP